MPPTLVVWVWDLALFPVFLALALALARCVHITADRSSFIRVRLCSRFRCPNTQELLRQIFENITCLGCGERKH
jgi:ribosomal protein S27E